MAGLWFVSSDHHCRYWRAGTPPIGRVLSSTATASARVGEGQGSARPDLAAESPCWIEDLQDDSNFPRAESARADGLVTGWGVPVRVGNQVIAVVEFFSRQKQREDTEMMATVETCAPRSASLWRARRRRAASKS